MSTPNTASSYINLINQNYPIAGQDNNSQGFRNNFTNIKQSLNWLDKDVYSLQLNTVQKNNDNDFGDYVIKRATFLDCATKVYDNSDVVTNGDIVVDYENGSYQKFKLSAGFHRFTFVNWPDTLKTGRIILSLVSESTTGSTVDFSSLKVNNLGPDLFPISITTSVKIFEIWNDGDSGEIFVQHARYIDQDTTTTLSVNTLVIGTNSYSTVTNIANKYATVVKANNKAGNLALVPNKIQATVLNAPLLNVDPGTDTADGFMVNSTNGIMSGATFNLPNSTSTTAFVVQSCTTDTVTVSTPFETVALSPNDVITFLNPQFTDQPKLVTFKTTEQNTTTSAPNDLQGTIYASTTSLYVAHSDHAYDQQTWLKITADHMPKHLVEGSTAITTSATNSSTFIATTAHVKNAIDYVMPRGSIILWYGSIVNIPTGWQLCNGTNGTPDLRNKFVIGAGDTYSVNATGGSLTTDPGGSHNHTNSVSSTEITVPNSGWSYSPGVYPSGSTSISGGTLVVGSGNTEIGETLEAITGSTANKSAGSHDHTVTINSAADHTHGFTPPYYALCYIMKL